jgi:predicted nucleic acid-binding protein
MAATGHNMKVPDIQIAATAIAHGMAIVTRNVPDFAPTGVEIINPWDGDAQES